MSLNKDNKIKSRISLAKERALKVYNEGGDLNEYLNVCLKYEHYSGAEGIRLVMKEKAVTINS